MYMKKKLLLFSTLFFLGTAAFAQSQQSMLYSNEPQLAKNKKLVYDWWRSVLEGGHLELVPQYLPENFMQHNPNVPQGRQGFLDFFSKFAKTRPIVDTIKSPLIAIVAEGDRVVLSFKAFHRDPKDATKIYTTTTFDMFRIENGKIAEHWDPDLKE
jgi:predicted SnoaL-like aldol condensation-catalyzing enzyme